MSSSPVHAISTLFTAGGPTGQWTTALAPWADCGSHERIAELCLMQKSLYPLHTFGAWVTRKNPKSEIRNPKFYVKLYVGILFDLGYLTIEPSTLKIKVSRRIREEFENGRDYYRLDNQPLRQPENQLAFPSIEKLTYHYENEFRG